MAKARRRRARPRRQRPETTRPEPQVSPPPEAGTAARAIGRKLDAYPDRIDIRDWVYRPHLRPLPDRVVNCEQVPAILDQGREGACTGFALAAVINFHLARRNLRRRASPQMLYEIARRYDEWPGEDYEGSSARGAMKGWIAHGVCTDASWPVTAKGLEHFDAAVAREARGTPGGAYFRVMHREVRDMHAALAESGILYMTLMVHSGWSEPGPKTEEVYYVDNGNAVHRRLPIIQRAGRANGGHAVAIVGYTAHGFIIQNSWGPGWGDRGFALLPYEDFLIHSTDVWVAQLGVPVEPDLWLEGKAADTTAGIQRAAPAIPLSQIRPFVIDVGNNGELSQSGAYWTTPADVDRLFRNEIPNRAADWDTIRILLYLHGGLNDEKAVAKRIVAFRDVMLDNEIYPVHIMWESGIMESLEGMLRDLFTDVDERAGGVSEWLGRFREGLLEARDRTFELTAAWPGTLLWNEMKENARLASLHPEKRGAMQVIARLASKAVADLPREIQKRLELHVVGHSAGSIFAAHAFSHLSGTGIRLATVQFLAPAVTLEVFEKQVVPLVDGGQCPHPTVYILNDSLERDDTVGPYGKSLLYLVSNAFEGKRDTPLLGMERFISHVNPAMKKFFAGKVGGQPSLVIAGKGGKLPNSSLSRTHGGFDNDPDTMNSVLWRILGRKPRRLFLDRDLHY